MRHLTFILFLLIHSIGYSQTLEEVNGKYKLAIEDSTYKNDKNKTFEIINKWMNERFANENIINKNFQEGTLTAKGTLPLSDIPHLISCTMTDVRLHFTITISISEKIYKITFSDMIVTNRTVCYQSNGSPPTSQYFEHPLEKLHLSNKKKKRTMNQVETKLLLLTKDLETYFKSQEQLIHD